MHHNPFSSICISQAVGVYFVPFDNRDFADFETNMLGFRCTKKAINKVSVSIYNKRIMEFDSGEVLCYFKNVSRLLSLLA